MVKISRTIIKISENKMRNSGIKISEKLLIDKKEI